MNDLEQDDDEGLRLEFPEDLEVLLFQWWSGN